MAKKKKWISGMKLKEGALTKMAKKKGMSISKYCSQKNLSPTAKKRCALAKTFRKLSRKK